MINCSFWLAFLVTALCLSSVEEVGESLDPRSIDKPSEWCHWINNRKCPDPEVRFHLFTRSNIDEQQLIHIDDTWEASNLSDSFFDPQKPSKIIIHGFRSDMFLTPLFEMKIGEKWADGNEFGTTWSETRIIINAKQLKNRRNKLALSFVVHEFVFVSFCFTKSNIFATSQAHILAFLHPCSLKIINTDPKY